MGVRRDEKRWDSGLVTEFFEEKSQSRHKTPLGKAPRLPGTGIYAGYSS